MSLLSYSLHIGVNQVDGMHYQGWDGLLECCENDALFYKSVAERSGFTRSVLLVSSDKANQPTSANLTSFLTSSSKELRKGDYLFITYSGHGGMVADENFDEPDGQDETWCLTDRQYLDDELMEQFSRFERGVRIFVISDSCHSGSVIRGSDDNILSEEMLRIRQAPRNTLFSTFEQNKATYKPLMRRGIVRPENIGASVMLFAACQDDEKAAEKNGYGLFTASIKRVLEGRGAINTYKDLFQAIEEGMPATQHPNLFFYGSNEFLSLQDKPFLFDGFTPMVPEATATVVLQESPCTCLIIELNPAETKLIDATGYTLSPGTKGYLVKAVTHTDGEHAWDKAYEEYFQLRKAGYSIAFVEPGWENEWTASPEKAKAARAAQVWSGQLPPLKWRGAGAEEEEERMELIDDTLRQMLLLEIGQLVRKDPLLLPYLEQAPHLVPDNSTPYETFLGLVRRSLYGSITLQSIL